MDYKKIAQVIGTIIGVIVVYLLHVTLVKNEVSKNMMQERENFAKELADKTLQLENEKIKIENKLKNDIVTLETSIRECKIRLEEIDKKKELSELSKKNPAKFKKTIDESLGVKGKTK